MGSQQQVSRHRVLTKLLSAEKIDFLDGYVRRGFRLRQFYNPDQIVPGSRAAYGNPLMESLLSELQPYVECEVGSSLYPTYSYLRSYATGDRLPRHEDRPACEVSVSLCISLEPPVPWPLFLEEGDEISSVSLLPGDAVLYMGCTTPHWREPFAGSICNQVFLHYVRQDGEHAEERFDRRPSLTSLSDVPPQLPGPSR
jgi:hypothetical protein